MNTNFIEKKFILNKNLSDCEQRNKYVFVSSIIGIIANIFLSIVKILLGIITKSISILGDGINNMSDCATSLITLIGLKLSMKPCDKEHPFGHARIEYITGFIISFVIMYVGFELLTSSIDKIFNATKITFNNVTIVILIVSIFIKFWLYVFNKKIGRKINSKTIIGVSRDAFNDMFITIGTLISLLIFNYFKINIDGYIGIIISIFIFKCAYDLAKSTLSPIIGEAPSKVMIKKIYEDIIKYDGVLGVHDLIVHNYGINKYFASIHIEFDSKSSFVEVHEIADKIERDFEDKGINIVVHADPIVVGDKEFNKYLKIIKKEVHKIDKTLSIHGFRFVKINNDIKLLFDVVKPWELNMTINELKKTIDINLKKINKNFVCIIRIDEYYNEY